MECVYRTNDCQRFDCSECELNEDKETEMSTLDEAIKHCEEKARELYNEVMLCHTNPDECAKEHEQLAKWLKELKAYRDNRGISIDDFEQAMNVLKEPCDTIAYNDDFATALKKMYEYEERQTEKPTSPCDLCRFDYMDGVCGDCPAMAKAEWER